MTWADASRDSMSFGRVCLLILLLSFSLAPVWAQPTNADPEPTASELTPDETPEETPEETTEPPDPSATDTEAADLLRERFRQIEDLRRVEVEVRAGVATLRGTALSFQNAERAAEIAGKTEGVVAVENQIEIETAIEERVVPAYDRAVERLRDIAAFLPLVLLGAGVVALFAFLARLVGAWDGLYRRFSPNAFVQDLARQVVQAVVLILGIVIALDILDATALVGAVLGSVGVAGLAVGFAFRDLVENYIASILLSLRRPFSPNDHVVIGSHEGKVMRLTSRATILMTLDGNHLRIPNSDVFKGVILNYTRNPKRRFEFDVGVGVEEDLLAAQRLGMEQLQDLPGVLDDPEPEAIIVQLGDSNVVIRFYGWVDQTESSFFKVKAEAIRRVKTRLESAGMDLPEPIYRVVLRRPGKAAQAPKSVDSPPGEASVQQTTEDQAPDEHDLAAGEAVDEQIARERAEDRGSDLLDPSAPQE